MKRTKLHLLLSIIACVASAWCISSGTAQEAAKPPVPTGNVTLSLWGIASQPIRFYHAIDQRFILEDFFAKLARWYRKA